MIKPYNRALGARENRKQLPSAALPLWCLTAPPFPRKRGHNKSQRSISLISITRHRAASTSPSGGGAVGRRGAFPTGEDRLYGFSLAPWGGFEGFIIRGAFLMSMRPPSCRLGFNAFSLTCGLPRDSSLRSE